MVKWRSSGVEVEMCAWLVERGRGSGGEVRRRGEVEMSGSGGKKTRR